MTASRSMRNHAFHSSQVPRIRWVRTVSDLLGEDSVRLVEGERPLANGAAQGQPSRPPVEEVSGSKVMETHPMASKSRWPNRFRN
jgi:hypothetical protein